MPRSDEERADLCEKALALLESGTPLKQAARDLECPEANFRRWFEDEQYAARYARARELCAHAMAEEILEIADDGKNDWMAKNDPENPGYAFNGEHSQRSRLRVDTRKWLLSKILPKQFGDKMDVGVTGTVNVTLPKVAADI